MKDFLFGFDTLGEHATLRRKAIRELVESVDSVQIQRTVYLVHRNSCKVEAAFRRWIKRNAKTVSRDRLSISWVDIETYECQSPMDEKGFDDFMARHRKSK